MAVAWVWPTHAVSHWQADGPWMVDVPSTNGQESVSAIRRPQASEKGSLGSLSKSRVQGRDWARSCPLPVQLPSYVVVAPDWA